MSIVPKSGWVSYRWAISRLSYELALCEYNCVRLHLWFISSKSEQHDPCGFFLTSLTPSCEFVKAVWEKVYFKSQILVHEYWTILDHFCVPVLWASGWHQHVLENVNITFSGNTGTPEMFQYLPILGHSSIWDLKYTFSAVCKGTAHVCVFMCKFADTWKFPSQYADSLYWIDLTFKTFYKNHFGPLNIIFAKIDLWKLTFSKIAVISNFIR